MTVEYDTPMKGQGYIQEAKKQIKKSIRNYIDDDGYKDWHHSNHSERIADINEIIDNHFKKLEK